MLQLNKHFGVTLNNNHSLTHSRIISGSIQGFIKLSFLYVRSHIGILLTVYNQCLSPLELWVRTPFMYLIQHYVIKSVSDLQQVCGFLRFTPPIKLTATIYNWNIVESSIKHHKPKQECIDIILLPIIPYIVFLIILEILICVYVYI